MHARQGKERAVSSVGSHVAGCAHPYAPVHLCGAATPGASLPTLLLLLRGSAFRAGGQASTRHVYDTSAMQNTLSVLHAMRSHALEPASTRWVVASFVDVPVDGWPIALTAWWQRRLRHVLGNHTRFRERPPVAAPHQVGSILQSVRWVTATHATVWDDMLILRPDALLLRPLPLPCDRDAVIVAFETRGLPHKCPYASPAARAQPLDVGHACGARAPDTPVGVNVPMADTIFWLPQPMHVTFVRALEDRLAHPPVPPEAMDALQHLLHFNALHDLCAVLPVRALVPGQYDTNTQKDYNPLYEMIGRPACGPDFRCLAPHDTAAARFFDTLRDDQTSVQSELRGTSPIANRD